WCERCAFTSRCLTFASQQEYRGDEENLAITNQKFWDTLHTIFADTKQMLYEIAEERGIVFDEAALAEAEPEGEGDRKRRKEHPLAKAAMKYAALVSQWLKQEKVVQRIRATAEETVKTGLREFDLREVKATTLDALEVIQWYQFFIGAKVIRSLSQKADD